MKKENPLLSGFKMFLMSIIPVMALALLTMALPYAISHSTFYVTPVIFIAIVSFLIFLRSKYLWIFKDNKTFDKISTVFIWLIFIPVIFLIGTAVLLIILVHRKSIYVLIWTVSVVVAFIFGIRIKIKGKLPEEQFILILNHCSTVDDVLVSIIMGRRSWKVVFAKEIQRIPFVGSFLDYIGIPISREKMESRIKVAKTVIDYLNEKRGNLLLFPEGRRLIVGKRDELLSQFQQGAFLLSKQCDVQIVPVVVFWTFLFQPRSGQWWFSPRTITIHYLDPVKIMEGETIKKFMSRTRELLLRELKEKLKKERN